MKGLNYKSYKNPSLAQEKRAEELWSPQKYPIFLPLKLVKICNPLP